MYLTLFFWKNCTNLCFGVIVKGHIKNASEKLLSLIHVFEQTANHLLNFLVRCLCDRRKFFKYLCRELICSGHSCGVFPGVQYVLSPQYTIIVERKGRTFQRWSIKDSPQKGLMSTTTNCQQLSLFDLILLLLLCNLVHTHPAWTYFMYTIHHVGI